jgi:hypothetical protein
MLVLAMATSSSFQDPSIVAQQPDDVPNLQLPAAPVDGSTLATSSGHQIYSLHPLPANVLRVPTWPTTDSASPAPRSGITHSTHPPDMVKGHVPRSERSERRRHPVVTRRCPLRAHSSLLFCRGNQKREWTGTGVIQRLRILLPHPTIHRLQALPDVSRSLRGQHQFHVGKNPRFPAARPSRSASPTRSANASSDQCSTSIAIRRLYRWR